MGGRARDRHRGRQICLSFLQECQWIDGGMRNWLKGSTGETAGQTHQIPRGFTGRIGKPKIQIPNPKQIPRSQIPKPGIGSRVGTWSLEFIWILEFGISRTEWKTFDASALP
jgi:hypothetical protein